MRVGSRKRSLDRAEQGGGFGISPEVRREAGGHRCEAHE